VAGGLVEVALFVVVAAGEELQGFAERAELVGSGHDSGPPLDDCRRRGRRRLRSTPRRSALYDFGPARRNRTLSYASQR
jgi:hypothetical protein